MSSLLLEISAAAELAEDLATLEAADGNLSVKGALAECKRLGAKDNEADRIIREIESDSPDGKMLKSAFTRLATLVRSFNRTSIMQPERMSHYLGEGGIEALARMQIPRVSTMLAVVRKLTVTEPQLWGTQDSPTSHQNAINKLKAELEAAYRQIEAAVTLADLTQHQTVSQDREEGKSILTFKITGDLLRLGDGRDVGERLTNWWLANDGKKRKAAA